MLTPPGASSLEDRAYDAVLDWLLNSGARPGDVVPLRELARQLGMSRTPVRFAVGRLHEQELLAYNPRVGFTLAVPTVADLHELFELRLLCESHAVQRYFERGVTLPERVMQLAQEGLELAPQIVADTEKFPLFSRADAEFHRALVALSGSRRLLAWHDQVALRMLIFRLGMTVPINEERFRRSAEEHVAVARALEGGDREAALSLLEAHISRIRDQTIDRMLRSADPAGAPPPAWLVRSTQTGPVQQARRAREAGQEHPDGSGEGRKAARDQLTSRVASRQSR